MGPDRFYSGGVRDALESEVLARLQLVRDIRGKMRDHARLNTLIEGSENDDQAILSRIEEVLSIVNTTPPFIGGFGVAQGGRHTGVPLHLMLDGTISSLLESASILLARNEIRGWSSGGLSIQLDQVNRYRELSFSLRERFDEGLSRWKIALNHARAVDATAGIGSDLTLLNRPLQYYSQSVFSGAHRTNPPH